MKRLLLLTALCACGTFEDPDIVLDLRVLAMRAEPPEQVVDVDLMNPQQPAELLQQLGPTQVCALVADPGHDRRLHWSMRMCKLGLDDRCEDETKSVFLGEGFVPDPELTLPEKPPCVTIEPDGNLLGVLLDVLDGDVLGGLGGVDYGVVLRVGGEDASPALDVFAAKTVRVSPRIPAERTANRNPGVIAVDFDVFGTAVPAHCTDTFVPEERMIVMPGQDIQLNPEETIDAREMYVVPTLDGQTREFTESLTYQWTATDGHFTKGSTGGPRDPFGNPAVIYTDWIAPKDVAGTTLVSLWMVQRDERLGVSWYETCIAVRP